MSEPVYLMFQAEIINAPRDLQAAHIVQQTFDHLKLTQQERLNLLRYLTVREEVEPEPAF